MNTRADPRTVRTQQSPECPDCGHARSTQVDSGWANDGTIHIRLYTCPEECSVYMTAELVLPPQFQSISQFDEHYRQRRRDFSRRKQGYHGTKPRGGTITQSARITGHLVVTPAKRYGYTTQPEVIKEAAS